MFVLIFQHMYTIAGLAHIGHVRGPSNGIRRQQKGVYSSPRSSICRPIGRHRDKEAARDRSLQEQPGSQVRKYWQMLAIHKFVHVPVYNLRCYMYFGSFWRQMRWGLCH